MSASREIFIGLGANLGDRELSIRSAIKLLSKKLGAPKAVSSLYYSKALLLKGAPSQPDFLNAAVIIESDLPSIEILRLLQNVEEELGRKRGNHKKWEPRTIDIDLLFAGSEVLTLEPLKIPHPELHKRDFVLAPLCEISPSYRHPTLGRTVSELFEEFLESGSKRYIEKVEPFLGPI